MKRKHQQEFDDIVSGIIAGNAVKDINIIATPGAGKSSIPIQACELIKAGLADAIMWAVPRSALQNQGERNFIDPFFREMFGHDMLIRESTNEINPCRGTNGFVTTYQAISADREKTILAEVRSKRYIIVLDEFHHLEFDGTWHNHIADIVAAAEFLIKMTGTLGRGNKKQIAYMDYEGLLPHLVNDEKHRTIIYSRTDALKERAILPIEFHLSDGEFRWRRHNGKEISVGSFKDATTPKQRSEALFTALNSEFAADLLMKSLKHWVIEKQVNPGAKFLIVTSDYDGAKNAMNILNGFRDIRIEIATSHKPKNAVKSINKFKSGECNCLVTIAMAYEGLDVPGISHICCLTNVRSREWIEQMLARGVRVDKSAGPYERQKCYVFAPQDKLFKKVMDMIKKQQMAVVEYLAKIKEDQKKEIDPSEFEQLSLFDEPQKQDKVEPLLSKLTNSDLFFMGLDSLKKVKRIKPGEALKIIKTVKEQEIDLRKTIHRYINKYCFENRCKPQRVNGELKRKFCKGRDQMTLDELQSLFDYLQDKYQVGIGRGTRKRVTNKIEIWEGS